jgi:hypothetical protein
LYPTFSRLLLSVISPRNTPSGHDLAEGLGQLQRIQVKICIPGEFHSKWDLIKMSCRVALQNRLDPFCVGLLLEDTANTVLPTRHNPPARVRPYDTPVNEVEMLRLMTPTEFSITHRKKTLGVEVQMQMQMKRARTQPRRRLQFPRDKTKYFFRLTWAYPTILTITEARD